MKTGSIMEEHEQSGEEPLPPVETTEPPRVAQITLVDYNGKLEAYPVVYGVITDEGGMDPVGFIPESDAHREMSVLEGILKERLEVSSRTVSPAEAKPSLAANYSKARELARRIRQSDAAKFGGGSPENGYKPSPRRFKA